MDTILKTSLWQQFGASIDMLEDALKSCPDNLWQASLWNDPSEEIEYSQFWFIAYHTLFWLDLYLSGYSEGFTPPAPFKRGMLPDKPYTKAELQAYLNHGRRKCQSTIEGLTYEKEHQPCKFDWLKVSFFELQLYNMRHVQEHGAQLHLLLGQNGVSINDWVTVAGALST